MNRRSLPFNDPILKEDKNDYMYMCRKLFVNLVFFIKRCFYRSSDFYRIVFFIKHYSIKIRRFIKRLGFSIQNDSEFTKNLRHIDILERNY